MKLLIVDTTSTITTVILEVDNKQKVYYSDEGMKSASRNILPLIEKCLDENSLTFSDVDYLGGVIGPGSFTGIRIGVSIVNGIAFASKIPLISLLSFEKMIEDNLSKIYLIDALHDSYYACTTSGFSDSYQLKLIERKELPPETETPHVVLAEDVKDINHYAQNLLSAMKFHIGEGKICSYLVPVYIQKSQAERNLDAKNR